MPKYRVLEKSYLPTGNGESRIFEEGEICDYDGNPSSNLEPMDDEGRARAEAHRASEEERVSAMLGASAIPTIAFTPEMLKQMADMLTSFGNQPTREIRVDSGAQPVRSR